MHLVYSETVSPIILAALWSMCIVQTISVLLWTINCALDSLRSKDDCNFTNFLINRVMKCSTKGASHCCFHKAVSNNYFQKFLLINFTSTCSNWINNFNFTHFLLIKGYRKYSLRKESVIAFLQSGLKQERVFLVNFISTQSNLLNHFIFPYLWLIEQTINRVLYKRSQSLLLSQNGLKEIKAQNYNTNYIIRIIVP